MSHIYARYPLSFQVVYDVIPIHFSKSTLSVGGFYMSEQLIYFLCTGNACRSQMAEGWAKYYAYHTDWQVKSAGLETHGLHPKAVSVMHEVNIDISRQTSDLIDQSLLEQADIVVTLCGDAKERCPRTPRHVKKLHWPLLDPAQASGTEKEKWQVFQKVRDDIGHNVQSLIHNELK